jgi:hypothetical protein
LSAAKPFFIYFGCASGGLKPPLKYHHISGGFWSPQRFTTSTNLKSFATEKSRRKFLPLFSGGFMTQKTAAKVCDQLLSGGYENRRKFSVPAVFKAFPAVFGRRKTHKFL